MKKYFDSSWQFALALMLMGVLGFLYMKTRAVNIDQHNQIDNNLRVLKQLDAEWNLDVLRSKVEVNKNYDPVTSPQRTILEIQGSLDEAATSLDEEALTPALEGFKAAVAQKVDLVDAFKSQNSVLKNSLRFLPTATAQLQQLISEAKPAKPEQARTLTDLNSRATDLLTETLKFNLIPDTILRARVEELIASLEADQAKYPEALAEQISLLVSHGRTVLRQKEREDAILADIAAVPTAQKNDQLGSTFGQVFDTKLRDQDSYREYLIAYSGFLLLVLGYVGYKLFQTFRSVREANDSLRVAHDTLEQKVAERTVDLSQALDHLKESESQLIQSEKMASLGQMVAGITHEINTPLAYVKSGLEIAHTRMNDISELVNESVLLSSMLQSDNTDDEALAHQFQRVSEIATAFSENEIINELAGLMKDGLYGIDQISEIVVNLKNFSRLDRAMVSEFNVNDGLDSTLLIAKNLVKRQKIKKMYGDIQAIDCSPSQINQVFLNLITNAAHAAGEDGEITLITKQQNDHVKIVVMDNGKGIPEDLLPKIFDPFFTTKKVGEGTGLGLSIVQRIIKEHGGEITVHSNVGVGSKFTVLLPISMAEDERTPEEALVA